MKKKCLIIQPLIPHYRLKLFTILSKKFPNQITFGFDSKNNKYFKNDERALTLKKLQISWIKLGSFIFNPEYMFLPFSKYEIIVFNDNIRCLLLIPTIFFIKFFTKKKILLWGHGYGTKNPNLGNILRKILYRFVDEYIAYSSRGKKNIAKISNLQKITVATNTIDLSNNLIFTKKFLYKYLNIKRNKNDFFRFLFISRIEQEKEPLYALKLMQELIIKGFKVEFKVIGSGSLNNEFIKCINSLNLRKNVFMYGSIIKEDEIISIAKDCDFLLHPGVIGLTTLVSLSLGIPVITTPSKKQMPEYEILKNKFNAIFLDPVSNRSNISIISEYLDFEKIKNLRLNSFNSINDQPQYNIDHMSSVFENIFKRYGL